jgi:hypothetical protein
MKLIAQGLVVAILGLVILMPVSTITNVQATTNQPLAEIEMSCHWRLLNDKSSSRRVELLKFRYLFNSYLSINVFSLIVSEFT